MDNRIPSCRLDPRCPLSVRQKMRQVTLIWDYHAGGEELPHENIRYMSCETAGWILGMEARMASLAGQEGLLVTLRGGDPFLDFVRLQQVCQDTWQTIPFPVRFEIYTHFSHISKEHEAWFEGHREYLHLWICCSETGSEEGLLPFIRKTGAGIVYSVTDENLQPMDGKESMAYYDIEGICYFDIPLRIEHRFKPSSGKKYLTLLRSLKDSPSAGQLPWFSDLGLLVQAQKTGSRSFDQTSGKCYDTTGWGFPCQAFSFLYLQSFQMDMDVLEEMAGKEADLSPLEWACPGRMLASGHPENARKFQECEYLSVYSRYRETFTDSGTQEILKKMINAAD